MGSLQVRLSPPYRRETEEFPKLQVGDLALTLVLLTEQGDFMAGEEGTRASL